VRARQLIATVEPQRAPARAAAILGLALLAPVAAVAAVDCSVSATGVAFGAYDPSLSPPDDSTGSITVTCDYIAPGGATDANYMITLSTGTSGVYSQRQMVAGAGRLGYNLFGDAGRSQVWGNASGGTTIISGTLRVGPGVGNGTRSQTHTLYGRVPALQDADTGAYADSILVTLTF
jgi:spore coat protein U-like protein